MYSKSIIASAEIFLLFTTAVSPTCGISCFSNTEATVTSGVGVADGTVCKVVITKSDSSSYSYVRSAETSCTPDTNSFTHINNWVVTICCDTNECNDHTSTFLTGKFHTCFNVDNVVSPIFGFPLCTTYSTCKTVVTKSGGTLTNSRSCDETCSASATVWNSRTSWTHVSCCSADECNNITPTAATTAIETAYLKECYSGSEADPSASTATCKVDLIGGEKCKISIQSTASNAITLARSCSGSCSEVSEKDTTGAWSIVKCCNTEMCNSNTQAALVDEGSALPMPEVVAGSSRNAESLGLAFILAIFLSQWWTK